MKPQVKNNPNVRIAVCILLRKAFVMALLIGTASCSKETICGEPDTPHPAGDGTVRIELVTNGDEFVKPVTRIGSADEDMLDPTPWVIVFKDLPSDKTFIEAIQAVHNNVTGKSYVNLTATTDPVVLLIMANAPDMFFNGVGFVSFIKEELYDYLSGRSYFDAQKMLTAPLGEPLQTLVPYTEHNLLLPMSNQVQLADGINAKTIINGSGNPNDNEELTLIRIVSKVTVENTVSGFDLMGATVVGASRQGYLFPGNGAVLSGDGAATPLTTDYLTTATGDGVTGIAAATGAPGAQTTSANPIYVYESKSGQASVIIRGSYNGTTGYYRLVFRNAADSGDMAIGRNTWYRFNITSVYGTGYETVGEAIAAPPSNMTAEIEVTDLSSHDIIDNGQYYLGVSNSEFLVYAEGALTDLEAVTVVTDSPASVTMRDIIVSGTGLTLSTANQKLNVTGVEATTVININLTAAFTSGTITVNLGNLTKVISVTRLPGNLSAFGSSTEINYPPGSQYTSATLGASASEWLSLSTDGATPIGAEFTQTDTSVFLPVYVLSKDNYEESPVANQSQDIYLTRRDAGRVKVYMRQTSAYVQIASPYSFVGTFHKSNQTGERISRIGNQSYSSSNGGRWTACIVEGSDWITLSASQSNDPGIFSASSVDMNLSGNDALYRVEDNLKSVSGNYTSTSSPIYFRVGMKSTYTPTAEQPARYGLILLNYNNHSKIHKIYVRQGEEADYLMRNIAEDNPKTGPMAGTLRTLARKISPYNLTDPQRVTGTTPVDRGTRGYGFTDYPSQAGYFFQWYQTMAWDPVNLEPLMWSNPMNLISEWNTAWETCPAGYHRPADGPTNIVNYTAGIASASELRQSLYLNPQNGSGLNISNLDNTIWGYLADGFFDRRNIGSSLTGSRYSVAGNGAEVAYIGRLFFNPNNNASVFFPTPGYRENNYGTYAPGQLLVAGSATDYWTSTSYSTSNGWSMHLYGNEYPEYDSSYQTTPIRDYGYPIRCVAD